MVDTVEITGAVRQADGGFSDGSAFDRGLADRGVAVGMPIGLAPGHRRSANVGRAVSHVSMRYWDLADRPREKMMTGHPGVLTDSELLAILIGSGSARVSAVELARQILSAFNGNLHDLAGRSVKELCAQFDGIGEAKAASILAALELGRRMQNLPLPRRYKITNSRDSFLLLRADMVRRPYEMFQMLLLTRSNHLIKKVMVSEGGKDKILVDPKKIFKIAIDHQASAIVLCHNHPSGQLRPSGADVNLTRQITAGAKLLDVEVLDHLIVGISDDAYFSFADEGCLKC